MVGRLQGLNWTGVIAAHAAQGPMALTAGVSSIAAALPPSIHSFIFTCVCVWRDNNQGAHPQGSAPSRHAQWEWEELESLRIAGPVHKLVPPAKPPGISSAPPPASQYLLQLGILPCQLKEHGIVKELVDGHLRLRRGSAQERGRPIRGSATPVRCNGMAGPQAGRAAGWLAA